MNIIGDKKRLEGLNVEAVNSSTLAYYLIGDVLKNIKINNDGSSSWVRNREDRECRGYKSENFKILLDEAFIKIFKERDIVINCKTGDQAEEFCKWMHANGLKWYGELSYIDNNEWEWYESDTCYSGKGGYCFSEYYQKKGYTIIEFFDCIIKNPETKNYKFKIGSRVKIVKCGESYTTYNLLAKKLKAKNYKFDKCIKNNTICIINNIGVHDSNKDIVIYLVEDIDTGYEYLIEEDGIEMCQEEQYGLVKDVTLKDILDAGPCEDGFTDLCNELLDQGCNASEIVNDEIVFNNENFMKYETIRDNIDWAIEKGFVKKKEKKFEPFDITFKVKSKDELLNLYHRMNFYLPSLKNEVDYYSAFDFPSDKHNVYPFYNTVKKEMYRIKE